ncbi:PE-PGRS family protein [Streptomyces sp. NPDC005435]|uniref:PE-PGRS family protein n=1 Tax=Streptomyces sp. NPDC005435 TaxID=3154464 RepID=UPI0034514D22
MLPPRGAWRPGLLDGVEEAVAVRRDAPDLAAQLHEQWRELAAGSGILNEDGVFLISVAGNPAGERWTRVRLTGRWDLLAVLGGGQGEFLTLAVDGGALVRVTAGEDEVRLTLLDRLAERREAAAREAVRETASEREAAWAGLFDGPEPAEEVRRAWADGLVLNPATPDELRHGLLGWSPCLLVRDLPSAVVEAAIAHPDRRLREELAERQSNITAEQWGRLLLGEKEPRDRWVITLLAANRRAELPGTVYEQLAADTHVPVREETVRFPGLPATLLSALAADAEPSVRVRACWSAWSRLDGATRLALLADPDREVRVRALLEHHRDHPLSLSVYEAEGLRKHAAESCLLERGLAEHLARHTDVDLRRALAGNPCLDPDLVALLAEDPDAGVRYTIARRPDLTEEQRAGIRYDFDPDTYYRTLDWVMALHDDHRAMRRLAASSHPLVRRSVARARRLPPDVVALLARDEDRVVQLFLAESCDDAPADMLLRVWQWWTGSLSAPDRPHGHPNFPRRGLLRHAADPNPRMRQLALDDPESTAELVEEFSRDTDDEVRYRAAKDPRLTPASAVRLLDDPDRSVRHAAACHPLLPARVLIRLLRDTGTAQVAAAHPALPVPVMEQMLQWIRRPDRTTTPEP